MGKADLIQALKEVNDIPLVETKRASKLDRKAVKEKIKSLHKERNAALEDKDKIKLKRVRIHTKALRRKLTRNA
jgi:predicted nuclease of restriction endonuclease-like (RecB) superfamily